jgi:hypothetical protein
VIHPVGIDGRVEAVDGGDAIMASKNVVLGTIISDGDYVAGAEEAVTWICDCCIGKPLMMRVVVRASIVRLKSWSSEGMLTATCSPSRKTRLYKSRSLVSSLMSVISAESCLVRRLETPTNSIFFPEV